MKKLKKYFVLYFILYLITFYSIVISFEKKFLPIQNKTMQKNKIFIFSALVLGDVMLIIDKIFNFENQNYFILLVLILIIILYLMNLFYKTRFFKISEYVIISSNFNLVKIGFIIFICKVLVLLI